jgi:hypothetical protein
MKIGEHLAASSGNLVSYVLAQGEADIHEQKAVNAAALYRGPSGMFGPTSIDWQ